MSLLFRAATAFFLAALASGHLPALGDRWRVVAADLASARPQARLGAQVQTLFHGEKGLTP